MAGDAVAASVSKPVLRGLHNATIKRNLAVAVGLAIAGSVAFKILVSDVKKKDYAEFYKNYDADKAFERMRAAGVLQSCPPDQK